MLIYIHLSFPHIHIVYIHSTHSLGFTPRRRRRRRRILAAAAPIARRQHRRAFTLVDWHTQNTQHTRFYERSIRFDCGIRNIRNQKPPCHDHFEQQRSRADTFFERSSARYIYILKPTWWWAPAEMPKHTNAYTYICHHRTIIGHIYSVAFGPDGEWRGDQPHELKYFGHMWCLRDFFLLLSSLVPRNKKKQLIAVQVHCAAHTATHT